jgi:eukaryotic-like serine/threonine-protein kinase
MVFKSFLNKKKRTGKGNVIDCNSLNKGYITCESCFSQHLLTFYKPLSFSKCSKCNSPIFIPHRVSDYWLYEPLGSGGMGSVYKAVHFQTDDKYSVKLLQRDSKTDSDVIDALLKEGEIGKLLTGHPNVCPVVEYGNENDEIYLVSRFLEGARLDVLVDNEGGVSEEDALLWGLQLLSGLQHIYKKGYLFKDMKPQNIIIDRRTDNKATLFDYGLCEKVIDLGNVDSEHIMGSPMFLPPERCSLGREGMYSEIYSLGMVLFYCLAGKPYYNSKSVEEIIKMHTRKMRVKTATSMLENINPDVVAILEKMIKREPAERFQTYEEVYREIKSIYDIYKFG